MNPTQRQVLWTTCASHGLIHVFELAIPPLLILIQAEFAAGDLQMGRVVSLYGLLFGLGALPAGFLADRIGSKPLLLICLWGASAALLGMSVSPTLPVFSACAALMGLCLSAYHPAGTALLSHAVATSGRVFALHGMAGNLGVAGSAVLLGLLGASFGWRWALAIVAMAGLAVGMAALRLPSPALDHEPAQRRPGRRRGFLLLLIAIAFMGMVYRGMTTFLPKFLSATYAGSDLSATALGGTLTTLALLCGLAGMYVAGRWADRGTHPAAVFLAGGIFQIPCLLALGSVSAPGVLPLVMAVAFFHFFTQPVGNQLVAQLTPPRMRGLGYGIYFFVSFGVGAVGAIFGGWVSEREGLGQAFPALALLLFPSIAAMAVLTWMGRRQRFS